MDIKLAENDKKERIFVDEHIVLESPSVQYAAALYDVINYNRDYFSQFMAWPHFVNHQVDTANFLNSCLLAHQKNDGKTYIILYKHNPVGLLSFNRIDHTNKTAYIGYWLDSRVQGKGIMTRAIKILTEYYASRQIIHCFVIKCTVDNAKSNEVAKRCAFVYEGRFRQAEYLNGIYHDQNTYGLILSSN
ncbi:50S ribosomal protein L7/L12-serine acetyltransferase [Orbus wheelerorum]|uniref:50S ribosomal protein L7/L12-serine acetyltransferase n=1 Tax=Orbus wheelerorum TaxID=3074111 RepID=UPI00370DAAB6